MSEQQHIAGPWQWQINVKSKVCALVSVRAGHYVMGFTRYGMGGAAPEFIGSDGLMSRAECFAKPVPGREHHSHWFQTIDNPNARLIAAAPELLEVLQLALSLKGGWREAIVELEDHCAEPVRLRNMLAAADQLDEFATKASAAIAKATAR